MFIEFTTVDGVRLFIKSELILSFTEETRTRLIDKYGKCNIITARIPFTWNHPLEAGQIKHETSTYNVTDTIEEIVSKLLTSKG